VDTIEKLVTSILKEAHTANAVIALKRNKSGNGYVKVATAMHRIAKHAEKLAAEIAMRRDDRPGE
jgi:hypothetical protein